MFYIGILALRNKKRVWIIHAKFIFRTESMLGFVSLQSRAAATDKIAIANSGCYDNSALSGKMLNHNLKIKNGL